MLPLGGCYCPVDTVTMAEQQHEERQGLLQQQQPVQESAALAIDSEEQQQPCASWQETQDESLARQQQMVSPKQRQQKEDIPEQRAQHSCSLQRPEGQQPDAQQLSEQQQQQPQTRGHRQQQHEEEEEEGRWNGLHEQQQDTELLRREQQRSASSTPRQEQQQDERETRRPEFPADSTPAGTTAAADSAARVASSPAVVASTAGHADTAYEESKAATARSNEATAFTNVAPALAGQTLPAAAPRTITAAAAAIAATPSAATTTEGWGASVRTAAATESPGAAATGASPRDTAAHVCRELASGAAAAAVDARCRKPLQSAAASRKRPPAVTEDGKLTSAGDTAAGCTPATGGGSAGATWKAAAGRAFAGHLHQQWGAAAPAAAEQQQPVESAGLVPVLPASPNWFCSSILSFHPLTAVALCCSKAAILLLDVAAAQPLAFIDCSLAARPVGLSWVLQPLTLYPLFSCLQQQQHAQPPAEEDQQPQQRRPVPSLLSSSCCSLSCPAALGRPQAALAALSTATARDPSSAHGDKSPTETAPPFPAVEAAAPHTQTGAATDVREPRRSTVVLQEGAGVPPSPEEPTTVAGAASEAAAVQVATSITAGARTGAVASSDGLACASHATAAAAAPSTETRQEPCCCWKVLNPLFFSFHQDKSVRAWRVSGAGLQQDGLRQEQQRQVEQLRSVEKGGRQQQQLPVSQVDTCGAHGDSVTAECGAAAVAQEDPRVHAKQIGMHRNHNGEITSIAVWGGGCYVSNSSCSSSYSSSNSSSNNSSSNTGNQYCERVGGSKGGAGGLTHRTASCAAVSEGSCCLPAARHVYPAADVPLRRAVGGAASANTSAAATDVWTVCLTGDKRGRLAVWRLVLPQKCNTLQQRQAVQQQQAAQQQQRSHELLSEQQQPQQHGVAEGPLQQENVDHQLQQQHVDDPEQLQVDTPQLQPQQEVKEKQSKKGGASGPGKSSSPSSAVSCFSPLPNQPVAALALLLRQVQPPKQAFEASTLQQEGEQLGAAGLWSSAATGSNGDTTAASEAVEAEGGRQASQPLSQQLVIDETENQARQQQQECGVAASRGQKRQDATATAKTGKSSQDNNSRSEGSRLVGSSSGTNASSSTSARSASGGNASVSRSNESNSKCHWEMLLAPGQQLLAAVGYGSGAVLLVDVAQQELIRILCRQEGSICSLGFALLPSWRCTAGDSSSIVVGTSREGGSSVEPCCVSQSSPTSRAATTNSSTSASSTDKNSRDASKTRSWMPGSSGSKGTPLICNASTAESSTMLRNSNICVSSEAVVNSSTNRAENKFAAAAAAADGGRQELVTLLLVASKEGCASVWNAADGKLLQETLPMAPTPGTSSSEKNNSVEEGGPQQPQHGGLPQTQAQRKEEKKKGGKTKRGLRHQHPGETGEARQQQRRGDAAAGTAAEAGAAQRRWLCAYWHPARPSHIYLATAAGQLLLWRLAAAASFTDGRASLQQQRQRVSSEERDTANFEVAGEATAAANANEDTAAAAATATGVPVGGGAAAAHAAAAGATEAPGVSAAAADGIPEATDVNPAVGSQQEAAQTAEAAAACITAAGKNTEQHACGDREGKNRPAAASQVDSGAESGAFACSRRKAPHQQRGRMQLQKLLQPHARPIFAVGGFAFPVVRGATAEQRSSKELEYDLRADNSSTCADNSSDSDTSCVEEEWNLLLLTTSMDRTLCLADVYRHVPCEATALRQQHQLRVLQQQHPPGQNKYQQQHAQEERQQRARRQHHECEEGKYVAALCWQLQTLGGWVSAMSVSPVLPSQLLVGCGDYMVRALDLLQLLHRQQQGAITLQLPGPFLDSAAISHRSTAASAFADPTHAAAPKFCARAGGPAAIPAAGTAGGVAPPSAGTVDADAWLENLRARGRKALASQALHAGVMWRGLLSSVESLLWHPTLPDIFAFGLGDGGFGVAAVPPGSFAAAAAAPAVRASLPYSVVHQSAEQQLVLLLSAHSPHQGKVTRLCWLLLPAPPAAAHQQQHLPRQTAAEPKKETCAAGRAAALLDSLTEETVSPWGRGSGAAAGSRKSAGKGTGAPPGGPLVALLSAPAASLLLSGTAEGELFVTAFIPERQQQQPLDRCSSSRHRGAPQSKQPQQHRTSPTAFEPPTPALAELLLQLPGNMATAPDVGAEAAEAGEAGRSACTPEPTADAAADAAEAKAGRTPTTLTATTAAAVDAHTPRPETGDVLDGVDAEVPSQETGGQSERPKAATSRKSAEVDWDRREQLRGLPLVMRWPPHGVSRDVLQQHACRQVLTGAAAGAAADAAALGAGVDAGSLLTATAAVGNTEGRAPATVEVEEAARPSAALPAGGLVSDASADTSRQSSGGDTNVLVLFRERPRTSSSSGTCCPVELLVLQPLWRPRRQQGQQQQQRGSFPGSSNVAFRCVGRLWLPGFTEKVVCAAASPPQKVRGLSRECSCSSASRRRGSRGSSDNNAGRSQSSFGSLPPCAQLLAAGDASGSIWLGVWPDVLREALRQQQQYRKVQRLQQQELQQQHGQRGLHEHEQQSATERQQGGGGKAEGGEEGEEEEKQLQENSDGTGSGMKMCSSRSRRSEETGSRGGWYGVMVRASDSFRTSNTKKSSKSSSSGTTTNTKAMVTCLSFGIRWVEDDGATMSTIAAASDSKAAAAAVDGGAKALAGEEEVAAEEVDEEKACAAERSRPTMEVLLGATFSNGVAAAFRIEPDSSCCSAQQDCTPAVPEDCSSNTSSASPSGSCSSNTGGSTLASSSNTSNAVASCSSSVSRASGSSRAVCGTGGHEMHASCRIKVNIVGRLTRTACAVLPSQQQQQDSGGSLLSCCWYEPPLTNRLQLLLGGVEQLVMLWDPLTLPFFPPRPPGPPSHGASSSSSAAGATRTETAAASAAVPAAPAADAAASSSSTRCPAAASLGAEQADAASNFKGDVGSDSILGQQLQQQPLQRQRCCSASFDVLPPWLRGMPPFGAAPWVTFLLLLLCKGSKHASDAKESLQHVRDWPRQQQRPQEGQERLVEREKQQQRTSASLTPQHQLHKLQQVQRLQDHEMANRRPQLPAQDDDAAVHELRMFKAFLFVLCGRKLFESGGPAALWQSLLPTSSQRCRPLLADAGAAGAPASPRGECYSSSGSSSAGTQAIFKCPSCNGISCVVPTDECVAAAVTWNAPSARLALQQELMRPLQQRQPSSAARRAADSKERLLQLWCQPPTHRPTKCMWCGSSKSSVKRGSSSTNVREGECSSRTPDCSSIIPSSSRAAFRALLQGGRLPWMPYRHAAAEAPAAHAMDGAAAPFKSSAEADPVTAETDSLTATTAAATPSVSTRAPAAAADEATGQNEGAAAASCGPASPVARVSASAASVTSATRSGHDLFSMHTAETAFDEDEFSEEDTALFWLSVGAAACAAATPQATASAGPATAAARALWPGLLENFADHTMRQWRRRRQQLATRPPCTAATVDTASTWSSRTESSARRDQHLVQRLHETAGLLLASGKSRTAATFYWKGGLLMHALVLAQLQQCSKSRVLLLDISAAWLHEQQFLPAAGAAAAARAWLQAAAMLALAYKAHPDKSAAAVLSGSGVVGGAAAAGAAVHVGAAIANKLHEAAMRATHLSCWPFPAGLLLLLAAACALRAAIEPSAEAPVAAEVETDEDESSSAADTSDVGVSEEDAETAGGEKEETGEHSEGAAAAERGLRSTVAFNPEKPLLQPLQQQPGQERQQQRTKGQQPRQGLRCHGQQNEPDRQQKKGRDYVLEQAVIAAFPAVKTLLSKSPNSGGIGWLQVHSKSPLAATLHASQRAAAAKTAALLLHLRLAGALAATRQLVALQAAVEVLRGDWTRCSADARHALAALLSPVSWARCRAPLCHRLSCDRPEQQQWQGTQQQVEQQEEQQQQHIGEEPQREEQEQNNAQQQLSAPVARCTCPPASLFEQRLHVVVATFLRMLCTRREQHRKRRNGMQEHGADTVGKEEEGCTAAAACTQSEKQEAKLTQRHECRAQTGQRPDACDCESSAERFVRVSLQGHQVVFAAYRLLLQHKQQQQQHFLRQQPEEEQHPMLEQQRNVLVQQPPSCPPREHWHCHSLQKLQPDTPCGRSSVVGSSKGGVTGEFIGIVADSAAPADGTAFVAAVATETDAKALLQRLLAHAALQVYAPDAAGLRNSSGFISAGDAEKELLPTTRGGESTMPPAVNPVPATAGAAASVRISSAAAATAQPTVTRTGIELDVKAAKSTETEGATTFVHGGSELSAQGVETEFCVLDAALEEQKGEQEARLLQEAACWVFAVLLSCHLTPSPVAVIADPAALQTATRPETNICPNTAASGLPHEATGKTLPTTTEAESDGAAGGCSRAAGRAANHATTPAGDDAVTATSAHKSAEAGALVMAVSPAALNVLHSKVVHRVHREELDNDREVSAAMQESATLLLRFVQLLLLFTREQQEHEDDDVKPHPPSGDRVQEESRIVRVLRYYPARASAGGSSAAALLLSTKKRHLSCEGWRTWLQQQQE